MHLGVLLNRIENVRVYFKPLYLDDLFFLWLLGVQAGGGQAIAVEGLMVETGTFVDKLLVRSMFYQNHFQVDF